MPSPDFIFYNGEITRSSKWTISPDNRAFRYGDGFFETMKMVNGKIPLAQLHMERMFSSLSKMQFQVPDYLTQEYILDNITTVARKNGHEKNARIRLTIFRGDGGLYEVSNHFPHHLMQSHALDPGYCNYEQHPLSIGIFNDARKSCDQFSSVKSNNFLPYVMAALWAKQQGVHDAVLLNSFGRVADTTIASLFIVKNGSVITPPLDEGGVNGVMRRYLLECCRTHSVDHSVRPVTEEDLMAADEIFLTNAVYGIRHVQSFGEKNYLKEVTDELHRRFIKDLQPGKA